MLSSLLAAISQTPEDTLGWLALSDFLEETGRYEQAELTRLRAKFRDDKHVTPVQLRRAFDLLRRVDPVMPTVVNSVGMELIQIPPGSFLMGLAEGDRSEHSCDDARQHFVRITKPFFIGKFPVLERNRIGAPVTTDNVPWTVVSHLQAEEFCSKLSEQAAERENGCVYRLPTEAEWEYACRATGVWYSRYNIGNSLIGMAHTVESRNSTATRTAGMYRPNLYGLYDMHGLVYEWCSDIYEESYYLSSPENDPQGPRKSAYATSEHTTYSLRGGSFNTSMAHCTSGSRTGRRGGFLDSTIGFRVVMTMKT